ncbi:hypothetical protein TVAG_440220 [Trichomonas vaginalis G3]|uniref:Uncharacterized protein n=1 Tax=Trichomonas vaginalis (strain ATCC PRA-98 / G3) TaxID=412133 RepID=A2FDM5_TRIV3|nr:hypothetical protein TVAGG3_0952670 [Trichomonas vaginalis G3]EAX97006.1 hypothetical protein TVAG_440220 [Trichomonas vaginalis G3]KAI5487325.1 hypothetical protein TVAGG3_0952670 [Trichomonas vaginalis G3]|eukprot:XP_001309936.1 hypothetical protein [Trichomonas vaginalis G3]
MSQSPQRSLHMSDLQSPKKSKREREASDIDFSAQCAASNKEIESLRYDIQLLMTKAHAYCKDTGVSTDGPILPSTPPRYSCSNVSTPGSPFSMNGSFMNSSSRSRK